MDGQPGDGSPRSASQDPRIAKSQDISPSPYYMIIIPIIIVIILIIIFIITLTISTILTDGGFLVII